MTQLRNENSAEQNILWLPAHFPDADRYQQFAMRTRTRERLDTQEKELQFGALRVASEAGEVAGLVTKEVHQGHPHNRDKLVEELGDILWGIASMCETLGVGMGEVMTRNVEKLRKRYPNGFSVGASIAREDVNGHGSPQAKAESSDDDPGSAGGALGSGGGSSRSSVTP